MKTRIHVNQHVIRANGKTGERNPVLTVKQGKKNTYAHEVEITGPAKVEALRELLQEAVNDSPEWKERAMAVMEATA